MRADEHWAEVHVDEYLWPLTGSTTGIDWASLVEEIQIRQRLAEIMKHVREMHLGPRLARLGVRSSPTLAQALTEGIIAGPEGGPPWTQRLKEPVPRALREEWNLLASRLRELREACGGGSRSDR